MNQNEVFSTLYQINVNDHTETKDGLTYLSWPFAISEVKQKFPDFSYKVHRFGDNHLPYVYDDATGYMVSTEVTIAGQTHEMWLPVMDGKNKAMKASPYTYQVWNKFEKKFDEKVVAAATMFDINKTIMRCLVKNIAMFGLGLYIYAGEDIPEVTLDSVIDQIAKAKTEDELKSIYKDNEKFKLEIRDLIVERQKEMKNGKTKAETKGGCFQRD